MSQREKILQKLRQSVLDFDVEVANETATLAIEEGIDPIEAINDGLAKGVIEIGERYSRSEIFLPELIMAAEAMKQGVAVLKPFIKSERKREIKGKFLIGTVAGDIHDIGKNIVIAMLEARNFEVYDLGIDVQTETFIKKTKEIKPDILGMSALLPVTMDEMKKVIDCLRKNGLRDKVKVIIGGAAVTQAFADKIGADAYGADAIDAVVKAENLITE